MQQLSELETLSCVSNKMIRLIVEMIQERHSYRGGRATRVHHPPRINGSTYVITESLRQRNISMAFFEISIDSVPNAAMRADCVSVVK